MTARHYIETAIPTPALADYKWDDANPHCAFAKQPALRKKIETLHPRLALAFAAANSEWTVWCLKSRFDVGFLSDIIEAAWVATADPRYLLNPKPSKQLKWTDWSGKDREPVLLVYGLLLASPCGLRKTGDPTEFVYHLSCLAHHLVPNQAAFKAWRQVILTRFEKLNAEGAVNYPIPPCAADPECDFKKADAKKLFAEFLGTVSPKKNKFLLTADEMLAAGFKGEPYKI
jgi:hypothetical protein